MSRISKILPCVVLIVLGVPAIPALAADFSAAATIYFACSGIGFKMMGQYVSFADTDGFRYLGVSLVNCDGSTSQVRAGLNMRYWADNGQNETRFFLRHIHSSSGTTDFSRREFTVPNGPVKYYVQYNGASGGEGWEYYVEGVNGNNRLGQAFTTIRTCMAGSTAAYTAGADTGNRGYMAFSEYRPVSGTYAWPSGLRSGTFKWTGNGSWYYLAYGNVNWTSYTNGWDSSGARGSFWPFASSANKDMSTNYVDDGQNPGLY